MRLTKLGLIAPLFLEISLFFSFLLQGIISWVAYKAFKEISQSAGPSSQPFLGGDPYAIGQPPAGPVTYQTTFGMPSAPDTATGATGKNNKRTFLGHS
mmetsp:Transcript_3136/g.2629  ORF Transcript_3136/g.2629 Transcript_3136/m.2629 type:complete len:98 (-) Transcript_3136:72-365(-)